MVWLLGTALVAFASVPLPSDGEYFWTAIVSIAFGLALAPAMLTLGRSLAEGRRAALRASGLIICAAAIASGVLLLFALEGKLGETAPRWIVNAPDVVALTVFPWMAASSLAERRNAGVKGARFWIGIVSAAALVVVLPLSLLNVTWTNTTIIALWPAVLLLWLTVPVWLILTAVTL